MGAFKLACNMPRKIWGNLLLEIWPQGLSQTNTWRVLAHVYETFSSSQNDSASCKQAQSLHHFHEHNICSNDFTGKEATISG